MVIHYYWFFYSLNAYYIYIDLILLINCLKNSAQKYLQAATIYKYLLFNVFSLRSESLVSPYFLLIKFSLNQ